MSVEQGVAGVGCEELAGSFSKFSKCGINLVNTFSCGRQICIQNGEKGEHCLRQTGKWVSVWDSGTKKQFGFSCCSSLAFPVLAVSNVGFQHLIRATLPLWQCFIGKPAHLTIRVFVSDCQIRS